MAEIKIRRAKSEDLDRVKSVTRQAYKIPIKPHGFVTRVAEPGTLRRDIADDRLSILVAVTDARIVGAIRYEATDNDIYLFKLAVLKTFRKRGVASLLVGAVEKAAKKGGYGTVRLDCVEEKGLSAYYQKLGYGIDRVIDHGFYHGVYMSKKIR